MRLGEYCQLYFPLCVSDSGPIRKIAIETCFLETYFYFWFCNRGELMLIGCAQGHEAALLTGSLGD